MTTSGFIFGLPPSLGPKPVKQIGEGLREVLGDRLDDVVIASAYGELEDALLQGRVEVAWGPPIICARIESAGGSVALRAVRYGATTYRAVLLCRAKDKIDLKELAAAGARKLRAAWVDAWSMGGYILPRYHLRSRGIELPKLFEEEKLLDSYGACFNAVLDGEADITASFAGRRSIGYIDLCGERAHELRALGYTDESPNDAIVLSPCLSYERRTELLGVLSGIMADPLQKEALSQAFDVDDFDEPPAGTYSALLALLA